MNNSSNLNQYKPLTISNQSNQASSKEPFNASQLESFRNESLEAHNQKRRMHHVADLVLDPELNELAQNYAENLAMSNKLEHSKSKFKNQFKGENLYAGGGPINGKKAVDLWYEEIKDYDFTNPKNKRGTVGHFTQLVWKGSKQLGLGLAKSADGTNYVVANYFPAGNFVGQEKENVLPQ